MNANLHFCPNVCMAPLSVTPGLVHGRSAAVPRASAGVCGSNDGERAASQAAFRRTGYSTGGLNTHTHIPLKNSSLPSRQHASPTIGAVGVEKMRRTSTRRSTVKLRQRHLTMGRQTSSVPSVSFFIFIAKPPGLF